MTKTQAVAKLNQTVYYLPRELPSEITWQTPIPSGILTEIREKKRKNATVITRLWGSVDGNTFSLDDIYSTDVLAIAALKAAYLAQVPVYEAAAIDCATLADATDNIGNIAPVAENLAISPASPTSSDDLVGSYDYSDADGHPESGTQIRWRKDGSVQSIYNDLLTIPSSATAQGEEWSFRVRPSDGNRQGDIVQSEPITIG